jgi:phosphohistidine phosphatase
MRFDAVIASPAVRVKETLAEVEASFGAALSPSFDKRVYLAPASTLLDLVHEADDGAATLLIVGHNPGLEQLAMMLGGQDGADGARAALARKYPTATIAEIVLEVDRWSDAVEGGGTLTRFIRPRDLDPELGPDEDI